jgi:type IV secretory pathway VirB2 component (pilin)
MFKLLLLSLILWPKFSRAQGLVPCGQTLENPCTIKDFFTLIASVINVAIQCSFLVALLVLIYAGYEMIFAGINGDPKKYQSGKSKILNVVIGILIIFGSYALVNTVMTFFLGDSTWAQPWS